MPASTGRLATGAMILVLLALHAGGSRAGGPTFDPGRASFAVRFGPEESPYRITMICALPGETVKIEVVGGGREPDYTLEAPDGSSRTEGPGAWAWTAPGEPGIYGAKLWRMAPADTMTLRLVVMVPFRDLQGEYLNGYRIGHYPDKLLKNLPIYRPPRGFIEVTQENEDLEISPHFRLGQFLCKQESGYPRYLVLKERLVLKLELLLSEVNAAGHACRGFHVMSGYRTPYYNRVIGNVKYSRHVYGGAADIFVDEDPADGMMDDLNQDGRSDYRDAAVLYDLIDSLHGRSFYDRFVGGLARYRRTSDHGPFVHVDVRGLPVRWGD